MGPGSVLSLQMADKGCSKREVFTSGSEAAETSDEEESLLMRKSQLDTFFLFLTSTAEKTRQREIRLTY